MNRIHRIALIGFTLVAFLTPAVVFSQELKLLFLGDQGSHVPARRFAQLAPVMSERGIVLHYTESVDKLNAETLKAYDGVVLYANIDTIDRKQATALLDFVAAGKGFIPLHCATFCFRNSPEMIALMGGQFQKHGGEEFTVEAAATEHPILKNYQSFESWDETYVHTKHNEKNRTVLEYRRTGLQADGKQREPWTWVRTHGKGRVFYTAWGHDERTWGKTGFQDLVERGIRWACNSDLEPAYRREAANRGFRRPFPVPEMTELPQGEKPFDYVDVGAEIPNYVPSQKWGKQEKPLTEMQLPAKPEVSLTRMVTPRGFKIELFASEPDIQGKPIFMTWDERGRLWVCETVDYPNELQPTGKGRDRIRICEDTNNDGKADKFTVFAEELSIPTSIAFYRGGAIVQNGVETLFLKDTDGDDIADQRSVLFSNWRLGDTHGGVSNFQYGLDNWIWAMQGYNNSAPRRGPGAAAPKDPADAKLPQFRMGFFRFLPDGSKLEFIRSTNNNTWGLGLSEEGLIFGSTANHNPSNFMPIPNRYYERVRGWAPSLTLKPIANTHLFNAISDRVRQVDHHGGYTAGAGHALYTARQYPSEYWNRAAFVCGPTGKLIGTFVLESEGAGFRSSSPFNLLASDDEWTAPIMAEVGPDGCVWVLDWYNFVVQHNPTPQGFKTGKGAAYETKLRDKKHGRIYRVVYTGDKGEPSLADVPALEAASPSECVQALSHSVMLVRKHAQRLLIERGKTDIAPALIDIVDNGETDEIGLNVGAIHALWTLHGLGLLNGNDHEATAAAVRALEHSSAGVRRNAIAVLPRNETLNDALLKENLLHDPNPQVRLAALLAIADAPTSLESGEAVSAAIESGGLTNDRWLRDAAISAAAANDANYLKATARLPDPSDATLETVEIVASHFARGDDISGLSPLLANLKKADLNLVEAVLNGLSQTRTSHAIKLTDDAVASLETLMNRLPAVSRGRLVRLAVSWGSESFADKIQAIADALLNDVQDQDKTDAQRIAAAKQLIEFDPENGDRVEGVLDEVSSRISPQLAQGLLAALESSRDDELGMQLAKRLKSFTPTMQSAAIGVLLKRPAWTKSLLAAAESGDVSLDVLALDQKQALSSHPDKQIRTKSNELFARGGSLPNADRQKVLQQLLNLTTQTGDADKGAEVFKKSCSKCHMHSGVGAKVGPDLTGMAVHPKKELLTHIIDPSRNVEGNFRVYTVLTEDGRVLSGMLASESQTAIELFNAEGKKVSLLRDDIDEMLRSNKSLMPEGFEKQIKNNELIDLLEFLVRRGKYLPLDLAKAATIASDRSMFVSQENAYERLVFPKWTPQTFKGIPFQLIDPNGGKTPNVILLNGPRGPISRQMPKSAKLAVNGPARAVHLLSGVSGWGHPIGEVGSLSMLVRLNYSDGKTEDHELNNGIHFADYIRRIEVPESEFAFDLRGQQLRYLAIHPKRAEPIASIEFVKGSDQSAPLVMAVTVESAK